MGEERFAKWDKLTRRVGGIIWLHDFMGLVPLLSYHEYWKKDEFLHYNPVGNPIS